jgi:hypothetical protein
MSFLRVFRTPKHQKFDYKPRYWDPQKEELQERMQKIEDMKRGGIEGTKARISSNIRRSYRGNHGYRKQLVLRSNLILVGIVVMLLILCYYMFQVFLPEIETFIGQ